MENHNDKSRTEKFNPAQARKKPEVERNAQDKYSEARKTPEYSFDKYDKADKGNKRLVILTITLAILLVIVCALAIYVIKSSSPKENNPMNPPVIEVEEEKEEEEEEKEVLKEENYSFVFYPESIMQEEDYLSIRADLYDADMQKKSALKVKINSDTDILVNGERISLNSFVYIVESLAGEQIVFEGVLNTEEKQVVKLSYNGEIGSEEINEEQEEQEEPLEQEGEDPIIIDGI